MIDGAGKIILFEIFSFVFCIVDRIVYPIGDRRSLITASRPVDRPFRPSSCIYPDIVAEILEEHGSPLKIIQKLLEQAEVAVKLYRSRCYARKLKAMVE